MGLFNFRVSVFPRHCGLCEKIDIFIIWSFFLSATSDPYKSVTSRDTVERVTRRDSSYLQVVLKKNREEEGILIMDALQKKKIM